MVGNFEHLATLKTKIVFGHFPYIVKISTDIGVRFINRQCHVCELFSIPSVPRLLGPYLVAGWSVEIFPPTSFSELLPMAKFLQVF